MFRAARVWVLIAVVSAFGHDPKQKKVEPQKTEAQHQHSIGEAKPTAGAPGETKQQPGSGTATQPSPIPDKFTNLQVFPKDIEKERLVKAMKSFTKSLGVRCSYCHMGKIEDDLSTYDFASDVMEHKQIAREMMKMTRGINQEYLSKLKIEDKTPTVSCYTCHMGDKHPKSAPPKPGETPAPHSHGVGEAKK